MRYYPVWNLGFVDAVTRHDMILGDKNRMIENIFGNIVHMEYGDPI